MEEKCQEKFMPLKILYFVKVMCLLNKFEFILNILEYSFLK